MAVHGIDNGLIPIVAYNYGAKQKVRIAEAVKWAMTFSALLYAVCFAVLELAPVPVLEIFEASDSMFAIGVPALRILAAAYFISIPNLVCAAALQGLSLGTASMRLAVMRQAVLPVLLALALRPLGRVEWIWGSFAFAELAGLPLAAILWSRAYRRIPE